jgi:hypothetical protein
MVETKETETIEMSIPVIGLVKGIWIMGIGTFAFVGTAFVFTYALVDPTFDMMAKALLGALLAVTMFGCMFGISRYFTEEQIKYTAINMKLK